MRIRTKYHAYKQTIIEAPLDKVKFRVKVEPDGECRWVPQIKFKIFWFIWSDWHNMGIYNGTEVKFGPSCYQRCCSPQQVSEIIASARFIFADQYARHKREATETAYYEV